MEKGFLINQLKKKLKEQNKGSKLLNESDLPSKIDIKEQKQYSCSWKRSAQNEYTTKNDLKAGMEENTGYVNYRTETNEQVQETCSVKSHRDYIRQKQIEIEREYYMNHILYHIYEVAVTNQVYACNFIHLHIPLALVLSLLKIRTNPEQKTGFLNTLIEFIIKKVQNNSDMKRQIDLKTLAQFLIFINKPQKTQQQNLALLRRFLKQHKELMVSVMPYYYNFFALVINKEIAFLGKSKEPLLQYSIKFQHKFFNGDFKEKEVKEILQLFEIKIAEMYHSKDI